MNGAKSLWQEFKGFALKGNIIDLAVAVVIGGAFGNVVNSLAKNVIMPLVSYVIPSQASYHSWHLGRVEIGTFLGELLNFFIIAGAMYAVLVKLLGLMKRAGLRLGPDEPATKECPMCLSVIPYRARKCGHCTTDLPSTS
jgi:large conductance mechanosensitive channel